MARINEISENEYISFRKQALRDIKELNLDKKNPNEKLKLAKDRATKLNFSNSEVEKLYIANLLIPDINAFLKLYNDCEKKINICAERIGIPQDFVMARIYEINKYGKFLKKGDIDMNGIEIIDDVQNNVKPINEEDKKDDKTASAIAKINTLFNENDSKRDVIKRQADSIEKLNMQINQLEEEKTKMDDQLNEQRTKMRDLEMKLASAYQKIQELTKIEKSYNMIIEALDKPSRVL